MKNIKKETFFLLLMMFIFIGIRSINYIYHVNWGPDQGTWGIAVLDIFRTKKLTLIGPQISANLEGRFIFQGPLIYYFFLFFLLLARWDPIVASYLFTLFSSLMIFPLYFGVKKLINDKAAAISIIIFTLLPYYINYTRFLWNSTFQIALFPFLLLFMGLYQEKRRWIYFLLLSIWAGILLQFHYQFVIVIIGLFIYYFLIKKIPLSNFLIFLPGIFIGMSPLVIFELKHEFYNLQTLILFAKNWSRVDRPGSITMPHYYITISFMIFVTVLGFLKKQIKKIPIHYLFVLSLILMLYSLYIYLPRPPHAYWAPATPWNYLTEKKIYDIIRSTKLTADFNVANVGHYDTKAYVTKYFMKRDGYNIDYEDYYHNKYLFAVSEGDKYLDALSYEVATFKPNKILKEWKINEKFKLLLLERI